MLFQRAAIQITLDKITDKTEDMEQNNTNQLVYSLT